MKINLLHLHWNRLQGALSWERPTSSPRSWCNLIPNLRVSRRQYFRWRLIKCIAIHIMNSCHIFQGQIEVHHCRKWKSAIDRTNLYLSTNCTTMASYRKQHAALSCVTPAFGTGWDSQGRHPTLIWNWLCENRYGSPAHGTNGLKSPPKDGILYGSLTQH